jgi:glutamate/aspartate transport system substrate-binding protein
MLRFIAIFVLSVAFGAEHALAASKTIDNIKKSGTIRLAYRESSVPFSYLGPNKAPTGYTIDLCEKVVASLRAPLGLKTIDVQWLPVQAPERIAALTAGKADLECGNTTNTPDRRKSVAFAVPTFVAGIRILGDKKLNLEKVGDLSGRTVVIAPGTTAAKLLAEQNEKYSTAIKFLQVKDNSDAMKALEAGQADAWVTDDIILYSFRAGAKDTAKWAVSKRSMTVEPLAIMFRKDDPEFADLVNKEVRRLMLSGEIHNIYKKWFMSPIPGPGFNLDLPMGPLLRAFVEHPVGDLPMNY